MITLTYGVLPTREQFTAAYTARDERYYTIRNSMRAGNYTESELWLLLQDEVGGAIELDDLDFASCILQTLGFEWV